MISMRTRSIGLVVALAFTGSFLVLGSNAAADELYLNEIYFDPPTNGGDLTHEYIELRGTPEKSLANHYLIFVEAEDVLAQNGPAGQIEHIFSLGGCNSGNCQMGSNGFFTLRQNNPSATNQYSVDSDSTNLANVGAGAGPGWGSGEDSLVFSEDEASGSELGRIENGGWTAMLIRNNVEVGGGMLPELDFDLDEDNGTVDGLDGLGTDIDGNWTLHEGKWTILDSVSQLESDEAEFGQFYGKVVFGPVNLPDQDREGIGLSIEEGAEYVNLGYEIEYLGRYGNANGQTANDWHVSNLTDNGNAGHHARGDFRQSGEPHGFPTPEVQDLESNQEVPYGQNLTNTLGRSNYPLDVGDYNNDGKVSAADFNVWRDNMGANWFTSGYQLPHENANVSRLQVTIEDFNEWKLRYGTRYDIYEGSEGASLSAGSKAIPEPTTLVLAAFCGVLLLYGSPRKRNLRN